MFSWSYRDKIIFLDFLGGSTCKLRADKTQYQHISNEPMRAYRGLYIDDFNKAFLSFCTYKKIKIKHVFYVFKC